MNSRRNHMAQPLLIGRTMNPRKNALSRSLLTFALSIATLSLQACSPSSLFGDNTDQELLARPSYQPLRAECAGLDLSQAQFSTAAFRQLINCLNSNGSIEAIDQLIRAMPDEELAPTVRVVNELVLTPDFVTGANALFSTLGDNLQKTFHEVGRIGETPELGISVLRLIGEPETQSFLSRKFSFSEARQGVNRDLLAAFSVIGENLSRENFRDTLEVMNNLATAPAFKSLVDQLAKSETSQISLKDAASLLIAFLNDSLDKKHYVDTGKILLTELAEDRIYRVADELIGSTPEQIRKNTARLAASFEVQLNETFSNDRTQEPVVLFDAITSLFHHGNRPIECLDRTKGVDNAVKFVIRELNRIDPKQAPEFLKRDKLLFQTVLKPFCDYPEALARYYPAMIRLADLSPIVPTAEMLQSIHRNGLTDAFIQILGNTGKASDRAAADTTGIKRLTPILKELESKGLLKDAILTVALMKPEHREKAKAFAKFLIRTDNKRLKGKSLYDILARTLAQQSPRNLLSLFEGIRRFTLANESFFDRFSAAVRNAHYANDYDVIRETVKRVLSESADRTDFYVSLLSASYRPEFSRAISDTAAMARNGQLREIFSAFLMMLERYGREQSSLRIASTPVKPFRPDRAHELTSKDLHPFAITRQTSNASDECGKIDLNFSIADHGAPRFNEQIDAFLKCFDSDGSHSSLVRSVQHLRKNQTDEIPPRTYFAAFIDLIKRHNLERAEIRDLTTRLLNWVRSPEKRIERLLKAIPYWVSESYRGGGDDKGGPVLKPLVQLIQPVVNGARDSLDYLMRFGSKVLLKSDFPSLIRTLDRALDDGRPVLPEMPRPSFDAERLRSWVENKECDPETGKAPSRERQLKRVKEIEEDFFEAATSWKRDREWKLADHRENIEAILKKIADPKQSDPNYPIDRALLNIMKYFTLEKGEKPSQGRMFTAQELIDFFHVHATDMKLITYLYPDESVPRVRLVSSIERLELIVVDADIDAPWPMFPLGSVTNLAVQFLTQIGLAWGDEPRELWPEQVRKDYPEGTRPPTLHEAIKELVSTAKTFESIMGFPVLPVCKRTADFSGPDWPKANSKLPNHLPSFLLNGSSVPEFQRRLFNLNQVLSIVVENLPGQKSKLAGGMRVLRTLFYELAASSPEAIRKKAPGSIDKDGRIDSDSYNISFIRRNVQIGLPRMIANAVKRSRKDDPILLDFTKALIKAASSNEAETLMRNLFTNDAEVLKNFDRSLIWKVAQAIDSMLTRDPGLSDAEWKDRLAHMRQAMTFGVPLLEQFGITEPGLKTVNAILGRFRPYLAKNADVISDLFENEAIAKATRALYEDSETCGKEKTRCKDSVIALSKEALNDLALSTHLFHALVAIDREGERNPELASPFRTFKNRFDQMKTQSSYRSLDLNALVDQMILFLQETPETGSPKTALRLREYTAKLLTNGEMMRWMQLASRDPDAFYRLVETLGQYSQNGELLEFLNTIERNVSDIE